MKAVDHYGKALALMAGAERVLDTPTSYDDDPGAFTREERFLEDISVHTEVSAMADLARAHLEAAKLMREVADDIHILPDADALAWRPMLTRES